MFKELCKKLETKIQESYETGVSLQEAERLAGEFLYALIKVSDELRITDLDARTKKAGVKAIRAAVYLEAATKDPKKPSDVMLSALVDTSELVQGEQDRLDMAEVDRDALERYYNIFNQAHLHFRAIAKGSFGS